MQFEGRKQNFSSSRHTWSGRLPWRSPHWARSNRRHSGKWRRKSDNCLLWWSTDSLQGDLVPDARVTATLGWHGVAHVDVVTSTRLVNILIRLVVWVTVRAEDEGWHLQQITQFAAKILLKTVRPRSQLLCCTIFAPITKHLLLSAPFIWNSKQKPDTRSRCKHRGRGHHHSSYYESWNIN